MSGEYYEQEIEEANEARHRLLVAAQWMATERLDYDGMQRRVDWVERDKFASDLRKAAYDYVQAVNQMTSGQNFASAQRPWDLTDAENLRNQVTELNRELAWRKVAMDRNDATLKVFVEHHKDHPLPEDVRKRVSAAMQGVPVEEVRD